MRLVLGFTPTPSGPATGTVAITVGDATALAFSAAVGVVRTRIEKTMAPTEIATSRTSQPNRRVIVVFISPRLQIWDLVQLGTSAPNGRWDFTSDCYIVYPPSIVQRPAPDGPRATKSPRYATL